MKKFFAAVMFLLVANAAFANATDDLIKALQQNPDTLTAKKVQSLITRGADVNYTDETGFSTLMQAIVNNAKTEVIRTLINAGSDVSASDGSGTTVLMHACGGQTNTDPKIVRMILEEGVNVNDQNNAGQSALMFIAANIWNDKAHEIAKILIEYGAYTDEQDSEGNSVYDYIDESDEEMFEIISNAPKG